MNLPIHHPLTLHPYARGGRFHVQPATVGLSRIALGATPCLPHWPQLPCEFCWPALVTAMLYVDGKACCHVCAANPNRVARLPAFARRVLQ